MNRCFGYLILAFLLVGCSARITIATPTAVHVYLDRDARAWQVYTEGNPTYTLKDVAKPSLDGEALQCSIAGGKPYSSVQCYRNLAAQSGANVFVFGLSFQFTPQTTYNNQGGESIVQAIEFSTTKWHQGKRYRLALQWENVGETGESAPQWRYWNPQSSAGKPWVRLPGNINPRLEAGQWHTLKLEGRIVDDEIYYQSFTLDDQTYPMNITTLPDPALGATDRLAVSIQLDGNSQQSPYDVFVDQVYLAMHP